MNTIGQNQGFSLSPSLQTHILHTSHKHINTPPLPLACFHGDSSGLLLCTGIMSSHLITVHICTHVFCITVLVCLTVTLLCYCATTPLHVQGYISGVEIRSCAPILELLTHIIRTHTITDHYVTTSVFTPPLF